MMGRMGEGEQRPELTRREREVVIELCRPSIADTGLAFTEPATVREIAERLFVSEAAVKQHLLRLYDKFEIPGGVDQRRLRLANDALARGAVTRTDLGAAPPLPPPLWPETAPTAEAAAGSGPSQSPSMTEARRAFARRAWPAAYAELKALDAAGALRTGDDLATLGDAALWCGQFQESIDVRLRAHTAHIEAGAAARASLVALSLAFNYAVRMKMSVAAGWLAKARRHVERLPEGREHGHLAAYEAIFLLGQGQADAGYDRASNALEIGRRHGDRDVEALGLVLQGGAFALRGRSVDAMALFDEAMASAVGGELGPAATGLVYCRTMCACLDLFEYRRAFEWTEVVRECRETADNGGFHGCRAHRAAVLAVRGESAAAEAEALTAGAESDSFDVMHAGLASYSIGELRLRSGDLAGAETSFRRAHELGSSAEPGLSLLLLARGDIAGATAAIGAALDETTGPVLLRSRLLPARVEIALAAGEPELARAAARELQGIAAKVGIRAVQAAAEHAHGAVAFADGDLDAAVAHLRKSYRLWMDVDAAYATARARFDCGRALHKRGDRQGARLELDAARAGFERIGAGPDARRASELIAD
jgi:ATP/maltotriose-dependent transcriptional regulator MalT